MGDFERGYVGLQGAGIVNFSPARKARALQTYAADYRV